MRDFHVPGRSSVLAENGMCATSHPLAAQAALEILKNGGNAMDAAIAGAVLLGICEPQMTGIGGDCFVLFSPAGSDEIKSMNGSGTAPSSANADNLRAQGLTSMPLNSPHAVTIPLPLQHKYNPSSMLFLNHNYSLSHIKTLRQIDRLPPSRQLV